ncbi:AI-2E family transporter [Methanolobus bombayensis]|uniref:AI-2E family transporter n=1 Tax=Methanolobus bombayensis TaxID=38023 RepID=UPI001AEA0922|nr:AI-2E family transporter [Methanolobus bombayensis]MBP1908754.1 putative PurR-regulated permease PerM [Methanolobus bombayensis]
MALTTNSKVWSIMLIVSVFLTIFFAVLFYFEDIFIVLIIGSILVLLTDSILIEFNRYFGHKSLWARRIYAISLVFAGILLVGLLLVGQLSDMNSLVSSQEEYESGITSLFSTYGYLLSSPDNGNMGPMMGEGPAGTPSGNMSENMSAGLNSDMAAGPLISSEDIQSIGDYIFNFFSSLISKLSYFVFTGLLIIPMMFRLYFAKKNVIVAEIVDFFPLKYQDCVSSSIMDIGMRLRDYFSAKILESVIVGLICCIGFYLAGINGWFFLGALAGLLNIVPYIGPVVGAIPAVIIAFIVSPTTALYAIITVLIAQAVDNLYLIPYMIAGKVDVNPLLSVLLTLIFADMLGALGMILAIPVYIIYKVVLTEFYNELRKIYPDEYDS